MTILFSPNVIRAVLLAIVLACAAAVFAPVARGAVADPAVAALSFPAEDWSWNEFIKYWGRQFGSLQGVVGTVMLVALLAVFIILSKGRSYMAK